MLCNTKVVNDGVGITVLLVYLRNVLSFHVRWRRSGHCADSSH